MHTTEKGMFNMGEIWQSVSDDKRRMAVLRVTPELVFCGLLGSRIEDGILKTWETVGLPRDVQVDSVWFDQDRRCFCFRLWSQSFAVTRDCDNLPELSVTVRAMEATNADRPKYADTLIKF